VWRGRVLYGVDRGVNKMDKTQKINEKILDELEFGYSCEKREHQGWTEQKKLKKFYKKLKNKTGFEPSQMFGRWQYLYRSTKGDISLIRINITSFEKNKPRKWVWEMWSNEKLFQDVIRFKTKKEAEKAIRGYLC